PPTGTFNFIGPKDKLYSASELIDLINTGMAKMKKVIVRNETTLTLLSADDRIPLELLPLVKPEDLPKRGKTEVVKMMVQLTNLVAAEFSAEAKKMLSSTFGEVVVFDRANRLLLIDTAYNLKLAYEAIKELEKGEGGLEIYSYHCKHIRA